MLPAPYAPPALTPPPTLALRVPRRFPSGEPTLASIVPPSTVMFTFIPIVSTLVRSILSYDVHEPSSIVLTWFSVPIPNPTVIPFDEAEYFVASYLVTVPFDFLSSNAET